MNGTAADRLGAVRAHRAALTRNTRLYLPVPGWSGQLIARYRPADEQDVPALGGTEGVDQALGFLMRVCDATYIPKAGVDDPSPADLEMVSDKDGEPGVGFSRTLGEVLEVPVDDDHAKPTDVVRAVFSNPDGGLNALALVAHAEQVAAWMADTSAEVEGMLRGN